MSRVIHPLRFRRLVVSRTEALSPHMRRIVFGGDDLEGFVSLSFDDHVKLFFPAADGHLPTPTLVGNGLVFPDGEPRPDARDFTPRRWDVARRELTIDFGLHGLGPATRWASTAKPGDVIGAGGPRASSVIPDTCAWNLLVGDETALPAIARRLEELPAATRALVVVQVEDDADVVPLAEHPQATVQWVVGTDASSIESVVAALDLPAGDGFAWIAGEGGMARRVRTHLITTRHLAPSAVKASAYWSAGVTGRHEVITD